MKLGVRLLLIDMQRDFVHFSDSIFARDGLPFEPIDEKQATVIRCEESRQFLSGIGISGEVIAVPSHSPDSIALLLDSGDAFVGDLQPMNTWTVMTGTMRRRLIGQGFMAFSLSVYSMRTQTDLNKCIRPKLSAIKW